MEREITHYIIKVDGIKKWTYPLSFNKYHLRDFVIPSAVYDDGKSYEKGRLQLFEVDTDGIENEITKDMKD